MMEEVRGFIMGIVFAHYPSLNSVDAYVFNEPNDAISFEINVMISPTSGHKFVSGIIGDEIYTDYHELKYYVIKLLNERI